MSFVVHEDFKLIDWIVQNISKAKYDFVSTGLDPPNLEELAIDLSYEGFKRNKSLRLEESIGSVYNVPSQEVAATSGCTLALFLIFASLLKPNDEVVVLMPNYPSEFLVPKVLGARVRKIETKFEETFAPNIEEIENTVSKNTKMLILTNSNNPTGMKLARREMEKMAEITSRTGTIMVVDETFREFAENRAPLARNLGDHVLVTNTMAKYFGMGDLKVGWIIAQEELIRKIQAVNRWVSINVGPFPAWAAAKILENKMKFDERASSVMTTNLQVAKDFFTRNTELFDWVEPDGAPICFPRFKLPMSSFAVCKTLIEEFGIFLSPGEFFEREGCIRLSFTGEPDRVKAGFEKLEEAILELSKGP
jgi:aspartate/methionine/tyrosine aminotransferase